MSGSHGTTPSHVVRRRLELAPVLEWVSPELAQHSVSKARSRRIFISSTAEDLADYRVAAAEHVPLKHEGWKPSRKPPYTACMDEVDRSEALVVIVAHRYGWQPEDQPDGRL